MPGRLSLDPQHLFRFYAGCETLALAVSGGADSLALMLLAARWRAGLAEGPRLVVYTVDHALRPEAADEARFVCAEAEKLGLGWRAFRWEGEKPATGISAAARAARYRLMGEGMAADRADILLTAHHLGDQAETVLMRLAHGSGIEGLRGMDEMGHAAGYRLGRPLLGVHPDALREVVRETGLVPVEDPSNADPAYERVRWRLFLPQLAEMGITLERLGVLAQRMADAAHLIADMASEAHRQLVSWGEAGEAQMPFAGLARLNPQVAVALLQIVLRNVSGDDRDPPLAPLEGLVKRLQSWEKFKPETLHGCVVASNGRLVTVRREKVRRRKAGTFVVPRDPELT